MTCSGAQSDCGCLLGTEQVLSQGVGVSRAGQRYRIVGCYLLVRICQGVLFFQQIFVHFLFFKEEWQLENLRLDLSANGRDVMK